MAIRLALRRALRAPVHAVVMIGTLAIGLGFTIAMFDVVNGVVLRRLPFRDPQQLVSVTQRNQRALNAPGGISPAWLADARSQARSVELAGYAHTEFVVSNGTVSERVIGARVTAELF